MQIDKKNCRELENLVADFLRQDDFSEELFAALNNDGRKKAQLLAAKYLKSYQKKQGERERVAALYLYENKLYQRGYKHIAGIDEAGRGPLAGPVIASAVILPPDFFIAGLNDSKKLSSKKREYLYEVIMDNALAVGIGRAEPGEIDRLNILQADYLAMQRAVSSLKVQPDYLLVDGNGAPKTEIPCVPVVDGDRLSASIAAASIIAKVTRDREMDEWDKMYPEYQFAKHKGYGTELHVQALEKYGVCPIHRKSFSLVAKYMY